MAAARNVRKNHDLVPLKVTTGAKIFWWGVLAMTERTLEKIAIVRGLVRIYFQVGSPGNQFL
jgi:hypothetical protein